MTRLNKIAYLLLIALLASCNASDQIARIAIKKIKPEYSFTLDSVQKHQTTAVLVLGPTFQKKMTVKQMCFISILQPFL